MFSGIISEIGTVAEAKRSGGAVRLLIQAPSAAGEIRVNDSVCVSGVCQTVIAVKGDIFEVEAVEETLLKTTLDQLQRGSRVNVELPVRMSDRLGGHLVLGHVDCVGTVEKVEEQDSSRLITIEYPKAFARYLVPVGSIALDGISLTVARLQPQSFTVSIIPHTLENTTIVAARAGAKVNLEFDVIGKYIERLVQGDGSGKTSSLDAEKLRKWGYEI